MKMQIVAIISTDGYLLNPDISIRNKINSGKYGIHALRERADFILHNEDSLVALLDEKRQSSGTNYMAEATVETFDLIKGLFLYQLADELVLYMAPYREECGIRLFDLTPISDWVLVKEVVLKTNFRRLVYSKNKQ
jgi:hypothetical protein